MFCTEAATRCSLKKVLFRHFTKFTGKRLCWSLFFQAWALQLYWKRDSYKGMNFVNFVKFLRTPFLQNTSGWLIFAIHLTVSFCKEVLYILSNLLLLEKSTKTPNFAIFSVYKYILYSLMWMYFIDQNINTRNHVSLMR